MINLDALAQKTIVVSGINMVEGGIFTILHDCLQKLALYARKHNIKVVALVHDASKFRFANAQGIQFIAFPKSKKYWAYRLYYEYVHFKKLSRKLKPDIWLSLHDVTPNVDCKAQFVYCHNPNMFYKPGSKDWMMEYKVGVFHYFYKYVFRRNIHKNKAVFVQQYWIREAFEKLFQLHNVYVALPEQIKIESTETVELDQNFTHFFYPALSRTFKNFELIGEAVKLLPDDIKNKVKIHITIAAEDNKYAGFIVKNYSCDQINFIGKIPRARVFGYYEKMDALLFPSKIETWGLPISEARIFGKPLLLANLPYARESAGNYDKVSFFDADKPEALALSITEFVQGSIRFDGNSYTFGQDQFKDWDSLFDFILKD